MLLLVKKNKENGRPCVPFTGKVLQAADGRFAVGEFNAIKEVELGQFPTPEEVLQALKPHRTES